MKEGIDGWRWDDIRVCDRTASREKHDAVSYPGE